MDRIFAFMRENGFNALRVPFSAELALDPGRVVRVEDPALNNLGNIERLARFVEVAGRCGILVMMDMHRLEANGGITELWYNNRYPYSRVLEAWSNVIGALQYKWNFFAVDLKV
jgi:aryl-phospho-beta-D-glucosidase BglC (GH1 family)